MTINKFIKIFIINKYLCNYFITIPEKHLNIIELLFKINA